MLEEPWLERGTLHSQLQSCATLAFTVPLFPPLAVWPSELPPTCNYGIREESPGMAGRKTWGSRGSAEPGLARGPRADCFNLYGLNASGEMMHSGDPSCADAPCQEGLGGECN